MTVSDRLAPFGTTVFSEMTRLAVENDAINLGQGYPNWDGADFAKRAAIAAIEAGGTDQYPPSSGIPQLRQALATRYQAFLSSPVDPDAEVTITGGCTEALASTFLGLVDPGDEVVLFEPFYDAYPAYVSMAGATPRFVTLRPPDFKIDLDELRAVFGPKTRAVLVNTPHNPTGRVLSAEELNAIGELCLEYDALAFTDEVYEEMVFDRAHQRLAALPGMRDRTVTMSSLGKTFSLTGWKVGWAVAPPRLTNALRAAHQFLTFTTSTPAQHGAVAALAAPDSFYARLRSEYRDRRDLLVAGLAEAGLDPVTPEGTYFVMAGFERVFAGSDVDFSVDLTVNGGVACIPPRSFYSTPEVAPRMVRFAFCKDLATLVEAVNKIDAHLDGGAMP